MDRPKLNRLLEGIELVRAPKHHLATFGDTRIEYHLVSASLKPIEARLREGIVLAERPKILTPEALRERFEGFGADDQGFAKLLQEAYQEQLRALEYRFKNEPGSERLVHEESRALAERIKADIEQRGVPLAAVLLAPEEAWQFALMRFILEQSLSSFPTHVRDLERRGLFDPEKKARDRQRREIEDLFRRAAADKSLVRELGRRLQQLGLFEEYQDRFFALSAS